MGGALVTANLNNWLLRNRPFLVFIPCVVGCLCWLRSQEELSAPLALGWSGAGLFAWTLLEWALHRTMHVPTGIKPLAQLQDSAHLRHHREPDDLEHSVIQLCGSIPLCAVLFAFVWAIVGDLPRAVAFQAGLVTGYLWYEAVHLAAHSGFRVLWLGATARYHARHHHQNWNRGFGVTTPLWDIVFGTFAACARKPHGSAETPGTEAKS